MAPRSLFDDWEDNNQIPDPPTGEDIVINPPETVANHDAEYLEALQKATVVLLNRLNASEEVVVTAHRVADFVPDLNNEKYKEFWKEDIIPNLVDTVTQDVKSRSIMTHAFGSVTQMAIIMQKASEIVDQTHGSDKGIEIAKKNIPDALSKLEDYIKQVGDMENAAIDSLSGKFQKIFEIVGPEAVKFLERKDELQSQLNKLYERQSSILVSLSEKMGELTRYNYLASATEKQLKGAEEEAEATKKRIEQLRQLNSEIDKTIQSIPASQVSGHISFSYWTWFGIDVSLTSPEEQKQYYESMIMARNERIKEELGEKEAEQKIVKELSDNLSEYKGKYETLRNEVETLNKSAQEQFKDIQRQIDELYKKIQDADAEQINIEGMIGLQGKALIDCLTAIKLFGSKIKEGVSVYAPLSNILKIVVSLVKSDVELLDGSTTDIFLAARRLMLSFNIFMALDGKTSELLKVSDDYKQAVKN